MKRRNLLLLVTLSGVVSVLTSFAGPTDAQERRRPRPAPIPDDAPPRPENNTACNYQEPVDYLVRENFLPRWTQPPEEQRRRRGLQKQAVEWRTKQYGYFEGFGNARWNEHPPSHYAKRTEFMGLRVRVNEKIIPALECVQEVIRSECGETYEARRLSGLRTKNTYHNGQVSNHVYGIAVDVDPTLNTCCMCVAQWGDHPLCQREVESIYERMSMPSCWVHVFERFGFYWLGRDRLQDTMHFEFLGDPDHILKTSGPPPHMAAALEAEAAAAAEAEAAAQAEAEAEAAAQAEAEAAAQAEAEMTEMSSEISSEMSSESSESMASEMQSPTTSSGGGGCSVVAPGL